MYQSWLCKGTSRICLCQYVIRVWYKSGLYAVGQIGGERQHDQANQGENFHTCLQKRHHQKILSSLSRPFIWLIKRLFGSSKQEGEELDEQLWPEYKGRRAIIAKALCTILLSAIQEEIIQRLPSVDSWRDRFDFVEGGSWPLDEEWSQGKPGPGIHPSSSYRTSKPKASTDAWSELCIKTRKHQQTINILGSRRADWSVAIDLQKRLDWFLNTGFLVSLLCISTRTSLGTGVSHPSSTMVFNDTLPFLKASTFKGAIGPSFSGCVGDNSNKYADPQR